MNWVDPAAYVYAHYSKKMIKEAAVDIRENVDGFLVRKHWTDKAHVDKAVLRAMTFAVLKDIKMSDDDENILSDERKLAFASYVASWCVRYKPFQREKDAGDDLEWINEEFALAILLRALPVNLYSSQNYNFSKAHEFTNALFDQLKYGASDPQTLELVLKCIHYVDSLR